MCGFIVDVLYWINMDFCFDIGIDFLIDVCFYFECWVEKLLGVYKVIYLDICYYEFNNVV